MSRKIKARFSIAVSLMLIGIVMFAAVMTVYGWDFAKLSTVKYESAVYEINEEFSGIAVMTDTTDVVLKIADDGICKVVCYEAQYEMHSVGAEDGMLTIEAADDGKWYEYIGLDFDSPQITIYLPEREYSSIVIEGSAADVDIDGITAGTIDISVSTGDVTASHIVCAGDISIGLSTGGVELTEVTCKGMYVDGGTGDVSFVDVIADEKICADISTGDIRLENCDAAELYLSASTGDITGNLLSGKIFSADTGTGDINVPVSTDGGICEVSTSTGDISITVY